MKFSAKSKTPYYISILLLAFVFQSINASFYISDSQLLPQERYLLNRCGLKYKFAHTNDYSMSKILRELLLYEGEDKKCIDYINNLKEVIKKDNFKDRTYITVQSDLNGFYIRDRYHRYSNSANLAISKTGIVNNKIAYNFKVTKTNNDVRFDDSYISFFTNNNKVISLNRASKWWSPSENGSLILSNEARPFINISYGNNISNEFSIKDLKLLYDYSFFIGQLEKNREIGKAKLLGAHVTLYPHENFSFSLFRVAQFGGVNRDESLSTILNILIGRENIGSNNINSKNDPGNQLAGIDFVYFFNSHNGSRIYGQFVGEDEAGYLPSRFIYNVGLSIEKKKTNFGFEFFDTFSQSNIQNYTYNHYIYTDGYRYFDRPLGASIDADSNMSLFFYKYNLSNKNYIDFKLYKTVINQNNSSTNYWHQEQDDFIGAQISRSFQISKDSNIKLGYIFNNSKINKIKNNNFYIKLERKF